MRRYSFLLTSSNATIRVRDCEAGMAWPASALTVIGHGPHLVACPLSVLTVPEYDMSLSHRSAIAVSALLLLAACSSQENESKDFTDPQNQAAAQSVSNGAKPGQEVNVFLWRATLDTLSFMSLKSADPYGGVIITNWYQPPSSPGERFKVTAYILSPVMRSDGVRVSLFRQVQKGGQWEEAPVDRETVTEIENKILMRARSLRAAGFQQQ
ncbi:putative exported protein [Granulibacter bethesdensis CGDNIH4]|nr:putative exported protein [Granulibacter bethesdensis CGDNIH4]